MLFSGRGDSQRDYGGRIGGSDKLMKKFNHRLTATTLAASQSSSSTELETDHSTTDNLNSIVSSTDVTIINF